MKLKDIYRPDTVIIDVDGRERRRREPVAQRERALRDVLELVTVITWSRSPRSSRAVPWRAASRRGPGGGSAAAVFRF